MWKRLLIGAATLILASTSSVYAQAPSNGGPQDRAAASRGDASAFLDARIAALHSGLQLTPDQEKMWPAVEKAYRDMLNLRSQARAARSPPTNDLVAQLERRADALTRRGNALKTFADALGPLWQSLNDSQKRRFFALARPRFEIGGGFGRRGDRFDDRDGGRGDRDGYRRRDGYNEFYRERRGFGFDGRQRGDRDEDGYGYRDDGSRARDGDGFDRGRRGFDRRGFDRRDFGRDRDGFDRREFGRDGDGFDRERRGFDRRGFDRRDFGRDRDGFDRREFGRDGDGFDRERRGFERRDFGRGRDERRGELPWWHPDVGAGQFGSRDGGVPDDGALIEGDGDRI